jgi:hypothetical protein
VLGQKAWRQIQEFLWDDYELGGGCLGRASYGRIEIEAVLPNPGGSQELNSTTIEWEAFFPAEVYSDWDGDLDDYHQLIGSIHSHPAAGAGQPSQPDLRNAVNLARAPLQPAAVACGMVAYPEKYRAGTDSPDWSTLKITGYAGHADGRTQAPVPVRVRTDVEERRAAIDAELREFARTQRLLRRERERRERNGQVEIR